MVRMTIQIASLHFYPIKSCRGIALGAARLDARGIAGDRAYMVVDEDGGFLTQRELPRMALIEPRPDGEGLLIEAPGMEPLTVRGHEAGPVREVTVWDDRCQAIEMGDDAASWLSEYLATPCRLVRISPDAVRPVNPTFAVRADNQIGFADSFPLLLTSESSLADLNARMDSPLPMNRFRPNVVVRGAAPYAEDAWTRIRLGGVVANVVKPCARCPITTTNQETARRAKEPLRTLATYRHVAGKGVMFGQNVIHDAPGVIRLGDPVVLLD
jgi:uncharacterized protein YcbX